MEGYVGVLLCSPNVLISGLSQSPVLCPGMDICLDLEFSSAWVEDCATRRTNEAEAGTGYFALETWVSPSAIYNWLVAVAKHVDLQIERYATRSGPRSTSCRIAGITTRATSGRGHVKQTARNDSSSSRRRSIPRPFRSPATYYSQPTAADSTVTGTSRARSSTMPVTLHTDTTQTCGELSPFAQICASGSVTIVWALVLMKSYAKSLLEDDVKIISTETEHHSYRC
ncbi:hypothetical protein RB213_011682 [Colletotrichum asianum]